MDLRSRLFNISDRVVGSVRTLATQIRVFFDPKAKVFIDKGDYNSDQSLRAEPINSVPFSEKATDDVPPHIVEDVVVSDSAAVSNDLDVSGNVAVSDDVKESGDLTFPKQSDLD